MARQGITVLEASFEVANKVGGIYTVLVSKSQRMLQSFADYYTIGFYDAEQASIRFEPCRETEKALAGVTSALKEKGIRLHCGRWLVRGQKPKCLLLELGSFKQAANEIKRELWEQFKVDSLNADAWFDEPVIWAKAAGLLIQEMIEQKVVKQPVVCQFHEWLSGAGLLHLKLNKVKAKTVFTTHATVFGRAFAGAGSDLASLVEEGLSKRQSLPLDLVYKFGVQAKHLLEKASAEQADVFTTVSDVTAKEAHFVLGKKPEILTPNGLDMKEFPLMEDISDMHIRYRNQIRKFVLDYFVPYYDIDVKDTLFFFISGRHEFHNKGIDLFIDALGKLNKAIKKRKRETKKVIAFIFIPDSSAGRNVEMLKNISRFQRIEDLIDAELPKIKEKIFGLLAKSQMPSEGKVFEEEFLFDLKKLVLKIKASEGSLPPLSPFDIQSGDDIIGAIKENDLLNRRDDAVKVVYYPDYLSSADGLLGLNYYDAIIGCHVGIFPSYYEPWGYTPLETAALGVQSVTSDLSGFGQFIRKKIGNREQSASIVVLNYGGNGYRATVEELAGLLLKIYRMSKKERQDAKIEAKQLSFLADWGFLIENYKKAYQMALGK